MNFLFFESLTRENAQKHLEDFLDFGRNRGIQIIEQNIHFTTDADFALESLSPVFQALLPVLKTVPREPDLTLPEFIRNTESYKKNLFDFDEPSKSVVLAYAYYFGETFVGNYPHLSWATGNTNYAQANMPVVTGFKYNELPPILIAENIFGRVISEMDDYTAIDTVIETWKSNAEQ